MKQFECIKCGNCCRHLIADMGGLKLGLFLFPEETELFPSVVPKVPMWGFGLKGRSRPRPARIGVYQYPYEICWHINKDNLCNIYGKHPLICRAHPLSIHFFGKPLSASLSAACSLAQEFSNKRMKLSEGFPEHILKANVELSNRFAQAAGDDDVAWIYDLKTRKWHRASEQLLERMLK